jgi:hypothetical protein
VTADPGWAELAGPLPVHDDEVMASHSGQPTVDVQNVTHGAPAPEPDHGISDRQKYAR